MIGTSKLRVFYSTDPYGTINISLGKSLGEYGDYKEGVPYISGYMENGVFKVLYLFTPPEERLKGIGRRLIREAYKATGAVKVVPDDDYISSSGRVFFEKLKESL